MTYDLIPQFTILNTFPGQTEGRIVDNICAGLEEQGVPVNRLDGRGKIFRFSIACQIKKSDALIVHSPFVYALLYVILARFLGKQVIGFVWDHYPVTLSGKRFDTSLRRRLLDALENWAIALCSHLIVPSKDFCQSRQLRRAKFLPFWLPVEESDAIVICGKKNREHPRLIFAGQINETRGLSEAYQALDTQLAGRFQLAVASRDPLPNDMQGQPNVEHLGFLSREALSLELRCSDAGLVSLSRDFDGPGLPSKTWEYLSAGLPCIFFGKCLPHYSKALESSGAGMVLEGTSKGVDIFGDLPRNPEAIISSALEFSAHFELDNAKLAAHLRGLLNTGQYEV